MKLVLKYFFCSSLLFAFLSARVMPYKCNMPIETALKYIDEKSLMNIMVQAKEFGPFLKCLIEEKFTPEMKNSQIFYETIVYQLDLDSKKHAEYSSKIDNDQKKLSDLHTMRPLLKYMRKPEVEGLKEDIQKLQQERDELLERIEIFSTFINNYYSSERRDLNGK